MRLSTAVLAILGMTLAGAAHAASVQCTTVDKSKWLPAPQVKAMLEQHGFSNIGAIKPNDRNCYVAQAVDTGRAAHELAGIVGTDHERAYAFGGVDEIC